MTTVSKGSGMPLTKVTHRIDVVAPAQSVYAIVADVSRWPLYFPPTVRAERLGTDGAEETIRIWAMANDELRTWRSRRTLRPEQHRIEFEQIEPRHPVAAMGGAWTVEDTPDGCAVTLDHFYAAVDDDASSLQRMHRAVDTNSTAELAHLKQAAERGQDEYDLYVDFADSLTFSGSVRDAYDFIYDAAKWPERLPHVLGLQLREDDDGLQVMRMDTRAKDGSVHTTVSGRVCTPDTSIVYKQTTLPPALKAHNGAWLFAPAPDGAVTVTARHRVILDPDGIAALPSPPASLADARTAVRDSLGANSRATLALARDFIEARVH